jgi:hypothetical protein
MHVSGDIETRRAWQGFFVDAAVKPAWTLAWVPVGTLARVPLRTAARRRAVLAETPTP